MGCSASTAAVIAQESGSPKEHFAAGTVKGDAKNENGRTLNDMMAVPQASPGHAEKERKTTEPEAAAKTSGAGEAMPQGTPSKVDSKERRRAEATSNPLQVYNKAAEPAEGETRSAAALTAAADAKVEVEVEGGAADKQSQGGGEEVHGVHSSNEDKEGEVTRFQGKGSQSKQLAASLTKGESTKGGEKSKSSEGSERGEKGSEKEEGSGGSEDDDNDENEGGEGSGEGEGGSEQGSEQENSSGGSDDDDDDDDDDKQGGGPEDSSSDDEFYGDDEDDAAAAQRRKTRAKKQGPVHVSAPGKLAAPDPSSRGRTTVNSGVRMSWLRSWAEYVLQKLGGKRIKERLTSGEVCAKVVIPETSEHKCRYADLLEPGLVGPPDYFISHTWGGNFQALIDVLSQRLEDSPDDAFVWLDLCAINQQKYADKSELQSDDISGLSDVVGKVNATLFCLDENGTTLSRVWCLFEIWHTVKAKGPAGLQILTYKLDDMGLEGAFAALDVSKAQASIESDRVRILEEMEQDIGLAELTLNIKESFLLSTQLEAEQALAKLDQQQRDRQSARKVIEGAVFACEKAAQIAKLAARHDAAQAHAAKGCELYLEVLSLGDTSAGSSGTGLRNCLDWMRYPAESEAIERRILDKQREVLGPKNIHTLTTLSRLVTSLGQLPDRIPDAEALHKQLVAAAGPKHSLSVASAATLQATKGIHFPADQESVLRKRATEECQKRPGHPQALEAMRSLATNLLVQGKNAEAKEMQRRVTEQQSQALQQQKKKKGPKNIESQVGMQTMLSQLVFSGDLEGAMGVYKQMLAEVGPGSDMCQATATILSQSLISSAMHASAVGNQAEAEGRFTQAVEAVQVPLEHVQAKQGRQEDKLELMGALGRALCGLCRFSEAEQIQREVVEAQPKPTGIQHVGVAHSMTELASTLTKQDKHAEAEHWLRQSVNVYGTFMGPKEVVTQMAKGNLADCLNKQGKDAEAKALKR